MFSKNNLLLTLFILPLLLSCSRSNTDPVVAEFGGEKIKASEAFGSVKSRLFELEQEIYRTKEQAIKELVEQRLLQAEAKKQGLKVEQLLDKESTGETKEVSDKDVEGFLSSKGLSLKDPRIRKDDVKDYLKYRQKFEKRQTYVAKLRQTAKVKILIKEPEASKLNPTTDGYPMWGNKEAPVTIVEFSDFQCPFCSRAIPTLEKIKQEYGPEKVKLVFRHMPLPTHDRAIPAALASQCANDQGKFWEMHNILFENQTKLADTDFKVYAKKIRLDEKNFDECYTSKKHEGIITKSREEAERLGISATPSFIVNGSLLQGAQPFEKFKEKIDKGLNVGS